MRQVNVHEAKTELSKLLELVEAGERVVIARAGRPVAVLSAYQPAVRKRRLGQFRGQGQVPEDFDALPEDVLQGFEGGGDGDSK
jgi:prevent-host-death family protein